MAELSVVVPSRDLPEADRLAAAPIVITYYITSEVSIQTTVLGDARNIVSVAIMAGSITAWSGTMTQQFPELKTTFPVTIGGVTIETGAEFRLTVPTGPPAPQAGQVFLQCTIDAQGTSQAFSAQIANWNLTG